MLKTLTNRSHNRIQTEILSQMQQAKNAIWVAVAWFTDKEIYDLLLQKLQQNVEIRVLVADEETNHEKGVDFAHLQATGAAVYLIENDLMHHKFCVIDHQIAILGSYNYTYAAQNQHESVLVLNQKKAIETLETEFNQIIAEHIALKNSQNTAQNLTEIPTMEWWEGLLQYGNLKKQGLEKYTWQHIFMLHLAFLEANIVLNDTNIGNDNEKYGAARCFTLYKQEFGKNFAARLPKMTKTKLHKIAQIQSLWLHNCGLDSLLPLQALPNLQEIYCAYNLLTSIEPLWGLKKLQKLHCPHNQIESLAGLEKLENLSYWNFEGNSKVGSIKNAVAK
jgi:Leucine-rich repeat (LRR) protein